MDRRPLVLIGLLGLLTLVGALWTVKTTYRPQAVGSTPVRVEASTAVVYRTYYSLCDLVADETSRPPAALIGATLDEVRRLYPQWHVAEFTKERVILLGDSDDLCPDLQVWRHLRLEDGQLKIYYGKADSQPRLLKGVADVDPSRLRAAERQRLTQGVDLPGDLAVEEYLEGIP